MPLEFAGSQITGARARQAWRSRIDEESRSPRQIFPAGAPPSPCLRLGTLARSPGRDAGSGGWARNKCNVTTFFFVATTTTWPSPTLVTWCLPSDLLISRQLTDVHCSVSVGRRRGPREGAHKSRALGPRWPERASRAPMAAGRRSRVRTPLRPVPSRAPYRVCGRVVRGRRALSEEKTPPARTTSSSAPPCRRQALLSGSGAPGSATPSGASAVRSAPFVSRAGRGGAGWGGAGARGRVRAARAGALPVRARRARPATPAPPPGPRTRAAPSPPGESRRWRLQRLESACRAWRRRREEAGGRSEEGGGPRAGRKARVRRVRPRAAKIARPNRGATGSGPLHAEGGGRAGPRFAPAARRAHPLRAEGWRMSSLESGCHP
nr:translation initiation factor IF-2-like isoform X2 [Macaca fascicularis]